MIDGLLARKYYLPILATICSMGTYHITAKIKADTNNGFGMFLSGTSVGVNAAGTFKMHRLTASAPPPPAGPESEHNSTIPSLSTIIDSVGASWTVAGGIVSRNGSDTISSNVTLLLYYERVVYQQNAAGGWWRWDNNVVSPNNPWTATSDPRASLPAIPNIVTSRHPSDWLQVGTAATDTYFVDDNRHGAGSITEGAGTGQFMQKVERSLVNGPNGEVALRTQWRWPVSINGVLVDNNLSFNEVKGYPSIIYGRRPGYYSTSQWPAFEKAVRLPDGVVTGPPGGTPSNIAADWVTSGGSVSTVAPSGNPPGDDLPKQLPLAAGTLLTTGAYSMSATGRCHLAFDIWLQAPANPTQVAGFTSSPITHEIMIPLRNFGGYGAHGNRAASWYDHDVTIDDVLYHVYAAKDGGGALRYTFGALNGSYINEETGSGRVGWKFIVFQHDGDTHPLQADGSFRIDISKFLNHLNTRTDSRAIAFAQGTEHVVSAELGVEMVIGEGDCTIWNYKVRA